MIQVSSKVDIMDVAFNEISCKARVWVRVTIGKIFYVSGNLAQFEGSLFFGTRKIPPIVSIFVFNTPLTDTYFVNNLV